MSVIEFSNDQWDRVMRREKHLTIRRGVRGIQPGPAIARCSNALAVIEVTEVATRKLSNLELRHALGEGLTTMFELRALIEGLYPGIKASEVVTIISFDLQWRTVPA